MSVSEIVDIYYFVNISNANIKTFLGYFKRKRNIRYFLTKKMKLSVR